MLRRLGGDREMVDILAQVLHHDEQAVLTAVELALRVGRHGAEGLSRRFGHPPVERAGANQCPKGTMLSHGRSGGEQLLR